MSTAASILAELEKLGTAQTRKTWLNHGAQEPIFGVKVQDMKVIQKREKKNYPLSMELYRTGNGDAMYLAGLISDPVKMTKADLQEWADLANWSMVIEYTVPWTTAESRFSRELAMEWIQSADPKLRASGWNTYSSLVAIKSDAELDTTEITRLINKVGTDIHTEENRVKYTMNGFLIAVGSYVPALSGIAEKQAAAVGQVTVDMNGTACKVPDAVAYIQKVAAAGKLGKKRKTAFC
ncbi:DNA alkylation repair protein [Chitinophaga horti]|uniref:DNA alkylation repair protein n=1 Tax=Chitinophaga horti TaxID=2920382 RepID=A0ABY6J4K5_9BACT|nr:DNA alkylation repair protein [Chitinophaga horti]UYQ94608.1 DNA alkylation repair protein [Chitinophaga horti]